MKVASIVLGGVLGTAILVSIAGLPASLRADVPVRVMPQPHLDISASGMQTAMFAGGCFWGVQAVFQHVQGVTEAVSGYAGGSTQNPSYQQVSSGLTGHAEVVRVTFDPAKVSYATLLRIFFSIALDPTEINRQGPDSGTQYRSELFVDGPEQDGVAHAYIAQLETARIFDRPIATRIDPAPAFYLAEGYHQNYLVQHPNNGYIALNDMPKVEALKRLFPLAWRDTPIMVGALAAR